MSLISFFIIIRIIAYAAMAVYALDHRRWWVWGTFTALSLTTYIYGFIGVPPLTVEVFRTIVGAALIYVSLRRK